MRLTDFLPRSTRPTGTGGAEIRSRIPGSGGSSLPEAAKWPTASFSGKRHGFYLQGMVSAFANWRRDGYDFDSRWDEGLVSLRKKPVMDQFALKDELYAFELKRLAGFGKGGEKNFEGTVTDLQMGGYLLIRDFRQRLNKKGQPYGWPISVYATPEALWGYEYIASAYAEEPAQSKAWIYQQVRKNFPAATEAALHTVLGWNR